ncbi:HEAT repeat domain-containing protein [Nodosilinea sp. PGN35]|uniref:HEAT repeat domain-containing protein n=1 Tax=Nodosilinea sp. PGN35 TaxID=3020489 RepID=UPI0023B2D68E|nr:HEAT repeat domain-containing protein [Nodosilinea sp. TSF1-S3]MDF0369335.1 HEAT repeat domain-containing protein [Nodosilinea sp. TSF1-S3]
MTPAERSQLFETLSKLSLGDFEWLLFNLKPPAGIVPPDVAPQKSRVAALLGWADNFGGCGLSEVQNWLHKLVIMTASQSSLTEKFREYLDLVCGEYQNYWEKHVFIDEIREEWFEFELNTEVERKNDQEEDAQKKPQTKKQSILKAVREIDSKSLLIYGRSGSGKSTLLAKIFYEAALKAQSKKSDLIPILIELKSYEAVGESPGIQGLLLRTLQNYDPELDENDLKQIRKQKKLLLFIDGFNELADEKAKIKIKDYCKNIPIIVTSRSDSDWREIENKFEIDPLSPQEVANFFRERLPGSSQADLEALGNRVKDFGETPLMVWMLYSIFNTSKEIPETRGEAYRRFTTLYVEQAKEGIDLSESQILLRKLAFEMMQSCNSDESSEFRPQISEIEAQNVLGSEATLRLLRNCHLLNSYGQHGKRRIQFCHQSLQEYYAAEEILERLRSKNSNFSDDKHFQYFFLNRLEWTETISLMMSLLDDRDYKLMLRLIQLALDVDLLLGAKLIGNVKTTFQYQAISLLFNPKICKLIRIGLFKFSIRISTPYWLKILLWKETRSPALIEKWLEALDSNDSWVRWHAVYGLRYCEPTNVVSAFLKALDDKDEEISLVAVRSLAHINSSVILPCLIKAARKEKGSIRGEAIKAIGELRTEKAIPIFHEVLVDNSPVVRHNAVQGLSQLEPTVAVSELTSLTKNRRLFPAVTTFLGQMGTEGAFLGLLKVLENDKPSARRYAVEEIGKFISEMAVPSLIRVLNHDKDVSVRAKAVHTLAKFDGEEVVSALIKALDQEHHSVYLAAAIAVIKFEPEKPLSKLYEALSNKNIEVRASAIDSLRDIEADIRFPLLLTVLEDKEPFIRHRAAVLLSEIGDRGIDILHERLNDKDKSVRLISALSLAEKGIKAGIQEIILLLEEGDSDDQYLISYTKACSALRKLGLENIITDLRELIEKMGLGDNSRLVSQFLPEEVPDLLLFMDGEESLREDTRYFLSKISSENMISGLLSALTHSSETVRFRAANALREREPYDVLAEAAKTSIRQDNGMIFRSLIEIFPKEFHSSFIGESHKIQLRGEYSWDSTVAVLSDYTGKRTSVSAETIQILTRTAKKDNVDLLLRLIRVCSTIVPSQSAPILLKLLSSKHPIVRQTAKEQLDYLGAENFMPELLQMIRDNNKHTRKAAIRIVGQSKSRDVAHFMPILLDLLRSQYGPVALDTLKTIQANCQIYNYDISQLKLTPIDDQPWESGNPIFNIQQVGILNTGPVTNHGDQKGFG